MESRTVALKTDDEKGNYEGWTPNTAVKDDGDYIRNVGVQPLLT